MRLLWHENGWEDYLWWQTQDKKTIKRINLLIRDIQRRGLAAKILHCSSIESRE